MLGSKIKKQTFLRIKLSILNKVSDQLLKVLDVTEKMEEENFKHLFPTKVYPE